MREVLSSLERLSLFLCEKAEEEREEVLLRNFPFEEARIFARTDYCKEGVFLFPENIPVFLMRERLRSGKEYIELEVKVEKRKEVPFEWQVWVEIREKEGEKRRARLEDGDGLFQFLLSREEGVFRIGVGAGMFYIYEEEEKVVRV